MKGVFKVPVEYIFILLATGIGVGFAQGLLGVGGSFIMVPVMTIVFTHMGIPTDTAVKLAFGTSLLVVLPTAISSSTAHHRKGAVWWKAAITLGIAGAAGALLGATLTSQFISGDIIKIVFGAVVLLGAVVMLTAKPSTVEEEPKDSPPLWAGCGFLLGTLSGLLGLGGGIFMVLAMTTALKFKMHRAVGTSTAIMMFTSAAGALGYILNGLDASNLPAHSIGYLNLPAWIALAATSVLTAQVGARTAHRLTPKILRIIFIIVMVYIGLKMIGAAP
jgi:hypothetical protein